MNKIEYDITFHPVEEFQQVAVFCGEDAVCNVEAIPDAQLEKLQQIMNRYGSEGWELVQMTFRDNGALAFWKRRR